MLLNVQLTCERTEYLNMLLQEIKWLLHPKIKIKSNRKHFGPILFLTFTPTPASPPWPLELSHQGQRLKPNPYKVGHSCNSMLRLVYVCARDTAVISLAWAIGILLSYAIIWGLKLTLKYVKMKDCHAQICNQPLFFFGLHLAQHFTLPLYLCNN